MDDSAENNDFSSQTGTADESDLTCLPEPLSSLFDSTDDNDLTSLCKDIYSQYHQAYRQKYNFKL